jgi:hypothetical protein
MSPLAPEGADGIHPVYGTFPSRTLGCPFPYSPMGKARHALRLREPQYRVGSERPTYCSPWRKTSGAAGTDTTTPLCSLCA